MKIIINYILILLIATGCSLNSVHQKEMEKINLISNSVQDSLINIISLKDQEIDSLYSQLQNYDYIIDSLEIELDISNSRVAVNQNFHIPDKLIFADRIFDLTNERLYTKFEKIFQQELKTAHKFIPRSGKYFAIFDSIFSQHNIPLDVKYLAIAESQLSPMATSHVGAAGIWQFMPKTAKGFGMRIDSFVDERRDIFVSTQAAAQYLLSSHDYLKNKDTADWLLTMCAYNAGAGSIAKVIHQQQVYDFFDVLMTADETQKYVWRAAAIKLIFQNEEALFGNKLDRHQPLLDYSHLENVKLNGHYKIDDWAKAQGTSIGKILELNPWIKIYKQSRRKYSAVNNVVLPPGEYQILVPNESKQDLEAIAALEKQFLKENAGFFTHHIVKKGDTLYDIAIKYKTTINKIKSLNGLKSSVIYPGQKLRLYGNNTNLNSNRKYIVKSGDTVGEIAKKLGVSTNWIISNNNLKNNNGIVIIRPGQKLFY